jgi:hypothetical protein
VSVLGTPPYQGVQIGFRLTRVQTEESKRRWLAYPDPRTPIVVDGWHWPNFAAIFNARGTMRYGGPWGPPDLPADPPYWPRGYEDDFGGVVVEREGYLGPPLVSADWVNENGVTDLYAVSHAARIKGKFFVWPRSGECLGSPSPIRVWFAYCDLMGGGDLPYLGGGWPLEFHGTVFSYIEITLPKDATGSLAPRFSIPDGAPPPTPMQWEWDNWRSEYGGGAVPRYVDLGN